MESKTDLLQRILFEAQAYKNFDEISKLVENGNDLSAIPVQPLYMAIKSTPSDELALILPKMSQEQRQAMIDLDLWRKDVVDVNNFGVWLEAYSKCSDESIVSEFAESEDLLLFLKSRLSIQTFDVEDPMYPDHDYYFLTDDSLLLIEYDEEFPYAKEVQYLIRNIYSDMGVEKAYAHVFKVISDSFSNLQEEGYLNKKERLREFGFVDYFEAMEKLFPFASFGQLNSFIRKKEKTTGKLHQTAKNQALHASMLTSFQSSETLSTELSLIGSDDRQEFLQFSFIRLINSTMAINDGLKKGSVELNREGKKTHHRLTLGISYLKAMKNEEGLFEEEDSIFDRFDFIDLYKIGNTLVEIIKKQLKSALKNTPFDAEEFEYFLGSWWNNFLEDSFAEIPKVKTFGARLDSQIVDTYEKFNFWRDEALLFEKVIPFASQFFLGLDHLKKESKLNDSFYLNYQVDNIDFEAIMISSFMNYSLGNLGQSDVNKMGLTISELKAFVGKYCEVKANNESYLRPFDSVEMSALIQKFVDSFGFQSIPRFETYLYGIMSEHLNGYNFSELEEEDYKHIGGPILLNFTIN